MNPVDVYGRTETFGQAFEQLAERIAFAEDELEMAQTARRELIVALRKQGYGLATIGKWAGVSAQRIHNICADSSN